MPVQKEKKKRFKGFEFRTFNGRFQVAVTGLSNLQRERCFSPKGYPEASETVSTQQTEVSSSVNSSSLILSALCGRTGSVTQDTKTQHNFFYNFVIHDKCRKCKFAFWGTRVPQ